MEGVRGGRGGRTGRKRRGRAEGCFYLFFYPKRGRMVGGGGSSYIHRAKNMVV